MKKTSIALGVLGFALLLPIAVLAMENVNEGDFGLCYPDPVTQDSFVGKTLVNGRLRAVACMNGSKTVAVLPANTKIKIIAKTDGWYKVKTQDGKIGWMGSWIVAKTSNTSFNETSSETKTKKEEVKSISFGTTVSNVEKLELKDLYSLIEKIKARIAELEKKQTETVADSANGKLNLSATVSGSTVNLKWSMSDLTAPNGFKVVYSTHENPVYPGDEYHYLSDSSAYTDEWSMDPGTYYFRVCKYNGGGCDVYSNNVKVTVSGGGSASTAGKISLTGGMSNGNVKLNWSLNDMTSPNGFKIAVAEHENPVYPGDDYHYLSDKSARTDEWTDLSAGTYYFRVCEYLGGKCGVYSNNLKVVVSGAGAQTNGKIVLSGTTSGSTENLKWTMTDMSSPLGFKVVVADHENPVYPGDDYHYLDNASARTDEWNDLSSGVHYFRVCEYLGGKCGVYSNNLKVTLP